MNKVIKDYGAVATHGSKELRLQVIGKEKRLALVSYKDGMSMNVTDITDEVKELKRLLEGYLGYETPKANNNIVNTLTSLPAGDCNYQTALRDATKEELEKAIKWMEENGGKHATRIKMCQNALIRMGNGTLRKAKAKVEAATPKEEPKKEKGKVIKFPSAKPEIVKLETKGNNTYEECVEKLDKEAEKFTDTDSQYVIEGLKELCKVDGDFRNNVMRDDKTYGGFMEYMYNAAKDGYCIRYGNVGWLDRDSGLGLAIDYFNADLEAKKEKKTTTTKVKAETTKKKGVKSHGKNVGRKKSKA